MNHPNLALVAPEPVTCQLRLMTTQFRLGDIFTINSDQEVAAAQLGSNNVFSEAREIAHANKGTPVLFAGTFPDGKNRVQATVSVPPGESVLEHRERLAAIFQTSLSDVVSNHFTHKETSEDGAEITSGHHYLSLTAEL